METFGIIIKGNRTEITIDAESAEEAKTLIAKISQPLMNKFNIETITLNKGNSNAPQSSTPSNLDTI